MFHIPTSLHPPDEINTIPSQINRHLKDKYLINRLTRELTVVDVLEFCIIFQHHDIINYIHVAANKPPCTCNKVLTVRRREYSKLVHDILERNALNMVLLSKSQGLQCIVREEIPASCHDYGRVLCIGSLINLTGNTLIYKVNRFLTFSFFHMMLMMTKVYASMGHFLIKVNTINESITEWKAT